MKFYTSHPTVVVLSVGSSELLDSKYSVPWGNICLHFDQNDCQQSVFTHQYKNASQTCKPVITTVFALLLLRHFS